MNYDQFDYQNQQMKKILIGIFIILVICVVVYGFYIFPVLSKKYYAVIFKLNNGSENVVVQVQKNKLVSQIENPTMDNYVFVGWALEDEFYNFNTAVTANITLEAIWYTEEELKEIINNNDNHTSDSNSNSSNNGSSNSNSNSSNNGSSNSNSNGSNNGSSNSNLNGSNNGSSSSNSNSSNNGSSNSNSNSSNNGSNNSGANGGNSNLIIPGDVVVPIIRYQVTFDSNGGSTVGSVKVIRNGLVEKPQNPTKSGYHFLGWTLNGAYYDFSNKVVSNIKLVAMWEKIITYTVKFNTNGGSNVNDIVVEENKTIAKPTNPTKKGYKFVGWQLDGKTFDFSIPIKSNITLNAVWIKNEDNKDDYVAVESITFKNHNSDLVKINNVDSVLLSASQTLKIDATIKPSNATSQKIIWSSLDPKVAKVDQNGNIIGIKTGTTYIIATMDDNSYSKKILVNIKYDLSKETNAVGIYYTTWFNSIHMQGNQNGYYNITSGNIGAIGTNQYWGKPAKGYYTSTDKNVIKQHMRELTAAGIDFIVIDNTNVRKYGCYRTESTRCKGAIWWNEYVTKPENALIEAIHEMRLDGEKTPYIINWVYELKRDLESITAEDDGVLVEIYDEFYTDPTYADVWVYDYNKPLIVGMNNENSHTKITYDFNYSYKFEGNKIYSGNEQLKRLELKGKKMSELISYRRMTSSKYLGVTRLKPTDWSYLESDNNVSTPYEKQEQVSIVPAINNLQMSNETTAIGRRNGCTFYEQWQTAFSIKPKVVVVSEWNEWIVGRSSFNYEFERYVDNYNQEFSRDIEPQDGGLKDRYYVWLKKYIANYKNNLSIPSIEQVSDVTNINQCSVRIDNRVQPRSNTISIFGDGISAYNGTISASNTLYSYKNSVQLFSYPNSSTSVNSVNDMWWKILLNNLNYSLLSNESISNTRVTWDGKTTDHFYNIGEDYYMAGYTRINRIGNADKILIFAGLSDIIDESVPMIDKNTFTYGVVDNFADAYYTMLTRIKINYPNSKIICIIPYISGFGGVYTSRYIVANSIIKKVVNQVLSDIDNQDNISDSTPIRYTKYVMTESKNYSFNKNISYIELNSINASNTQQYLVSGVTPNKEGMKIISDTVQNALLGK